MKRIITFTLCVLLGLFNVLSNTKKSLEVDFTTYAIDLEICKKNGSKYTIIVCDSLNEIVTNDDIICPVKFVTIEVPTYCKDFVLQDLSFNLLKTIKLEVPLLEYRERYSQEDVTPHQIKDRILGKGIQAAVVDEYYTSDTKHLIKIAVNPILYNKKDLELCVYDKVCLKIVYTECSQEDIKFDLINQRVSTQSSQNSIEGYSNSYTQNKDKYVIITTESLKKSCERLAQWKKQKGLDVVLTTVNEILSTPAFKVDATNGIVDQTQSIREFLKSIYSNVSNLYCIFIGDTKNGMPFRYFYNSTSRGGKLADFYEDNFIPSDIYFSDLLRRWTMTKENDGTYTIPLSDISYSPGIYVGRLLCSSTNEFDNYMNKLQLYESFPGRGDTDYLSNGLVFQQNQHLDYPNLVEELGIYDSGHLIKFQDNNGATFEESTPLGSEIIKEMKNCGLYSWQGHGNPGSVACAGLNGKSREWHYLKSRNEYVGSEMWLTDKEMNNGLDLMNNEYHPSVAYSLSCDIMPFDDCKHMGLKYNIGSSYTIGGTYGGVALLGNTRVGWDAANIIMESQFARELKNCCNIGKAHALAKKNSNVADKYALAAHNIMGDPEIGLWLGKPQIQKNIIAVSNNSFNIQGNNLSGSIITLFDGDNVLSSKAENNYLTITFPPSKFNFNKDFFLISIWKPQVIPTLDLYGQNCTLDDINKSFITKRAFFGKKVFSSKSSGNVMIGGNSILNIKCIQSALLSEGFMMKDNAAVNIQCDGEIEASAIRVNDNSNLILQGKSVKLGAGTLISKGASLTVCPNK